MISRKPLAGAALAVVSDRTNTVYYDVTAGNVDSKRVREQPVQRRDRVRVAALGRRALHVRGSASLASGRICARRSARKTLLRLLPPRGSAAYEGQL